ncbi:MAG: NUDIX domain-containing protein [Nocardioides sp.]
MSDPGSVDPLPRVQRLAAYAVITRGLTEADREVLLCRLAPRVSRAELWTLPGGGVDHGEDPAEALLREIVEETGLSATLGERVQLHSARYPAVWRDGVQVDAHAVRIVYDAWVPTDAPEPRVVEVDGSTMAAAWHPWADVASGRLPVTPLVTDLVASYRPHRRQRVAAYGLIRRGDEILLTRLSERAHHTGSWTLPGGGIEHGEAPAAALVREVAEECGVECRPGQLLGVHDVQFTGVAPSGRTEDFHGIHLVYAATIDAAAVPRLAEADGTTDAVAFVAVADVVSRRIPVLEVVDFALGLAP